MKPLFKYLLIISSLGFGSLTFFGFIAYQSSVSIGIFKQHDLLIDLTHQMLTTKPKVNTPATLNAWLNNDTFISASIFTILIRDENNKLIASKSGHNSKVDITYVSNLKTPSLNLNPSEIDFFTHKNLRYIWHEDNIDNSPYIFILYYASIPNEQSFYFDYMGLPLIISAFITFWVSLWGALVLSNLFKRIEEQKKLMEHNSLHDTLTSLPNRALFSDRLNHAFAIAKRDNSLFSLCMLDLDRFKEINDTLGHSYGDKLLIEVSRRLEKSVRDCDTVSRFGGDEFAIIIRDADESKTAIVAKRISKSLKEEFFIDDERFNISGSLGISYFPLHGDTESGLLSCSDIAMYSAKKLNIDYVIYNEDEIETDNNKTKNSSLSLFSDLKQAIELDQFEVYYQPKLNVRTNKITSMEALLRWQHPTQGNIPPDVFIILAEETGLIRDITRLVIKKVLNTQQILKSKGVDLEISINLSTHDLYSCEICVYLKDLVSKLSSDSKKIVLEVTESAMKSNPAETEKALKKLSEMGFIISIDDFGTGYSSLSNLQDLTVKEIKIDRSFVGNMDTDENNARIVQNTISLAHDLKIRVVAEGAETERVVDMLSEFKCDEIQGYIISRPMPFSDILKFLEERNEIKR